jgi:CubicO group peptidase (beta-lactamase class C family)
MIAGRWKDLVGRMCTLAMAAVAAWPGSPLAQPASRGDLEDLVPRWKSAMERLHVPGMAVAVVTADGVVLIHAEGKRDLGGDLPVTPETMFYIASMTKPFVALATVLLDHEEALVLNRPVRTYLPRFELADFTETITITVRDLVAHRRGLQDYAITFGEAVSGQMTEDRFYRLLSKVEAVGELDYANLHYTLLGRIIEAVTGTTWKEYVEQEVLQPAGMARTTTRAGPLTEDPDAAVPYEWVGGSYRTVRLKTDRTMHAAGGMLSTVRDLARWIRIHLAGGRLDGKVVYPEEVIREMQKPQIFEEDESPLVPEHRRIGWGLGWDIREDRGMRLYHHGGSYEGWAAQMSFMPEIGTGVVVLTNARDGGRLLSNFIATDVYDRVRAVEARDLLPRFLSFLEGGAGEEPAESMKPGRGPRGPTLPVERYAGRYANDDWGTVEIRTSERELRARIGDLPLPLVWTGPDTFVADQDHEGRFEIGEGGRVTAVTLGALAADAPVRFERR